MAKTLAELIAELKEEIHAENGVPTDAQYQRAITEAVLDFSRRAGSEKITQLQIATGTAIYDLPADFIMLITLESFINSQQILAEYQQFDQGIPSSFSGLTYNPGVMVTSEGLIPLPYRFNETYTIRDFKLTIVPTPGYTLTRYLRYKAGWALTGDMGSEQYADMTDEESDIILLKAEALCLTKKANALSGGAYKYQIGAVQVDLTGLTQSQKQAISGLESDYDKRVEQYIGQAFDMG
jgi:hypothetical protein